MHQELIEFTKSQDFNEALEQLTHLLTKQSQILFFDQLYSNLEKNEEITIFKGKGVLTFNIGRIYIDGLENVFKILILSFYFRNLLFPNKTIVNTESLNKFLIKKYKKIEKFTLESLLSNINDFLHKVAHYDNNYNSKVDQSMNHNVLFNYTEINVGYLPGYYIIIGNSSITIDETIDAALDSNNEFKKSFISVNLFEMEIGPHVNRNKSQLSFYLHDAVHFTNFKKTLETIHEFNVLDIFMSFYNECKVNKRSFIHRYISSLFFYPLHEADHFYNGGYNMFKEMSEISKIEEPKYEHLVSIFFDSFDKSYVQVDDLRSILKYIIRATDYEVSLENKKIFNDAFTFENKEYSYGEIKTVKDDFYNFGEDYTPQPILENANEILDRLKYVFLLLSQDFLERVNDL